MNPEDVRQLATSESVPVWKGSAEGCADAESVALPLPKEYNGDELVRH